MTLLLSNDELVIDDLVLDVAGSYITDALEVVIAAGPVRKARTDNRTPIEVLDSVEIFWHKRIGRNC